MGGRRDRSIGVNEFEEIRVKDSQYSPIHIETALSKDL